jgi:hypothetical protein
MSRPSAAWLCVLCIVLLLVGAPGSSWAQQQIDLALVLAVDTSGSMDPDELELQRQGYVEAFRSPMLHGAIHTGVLGQIAVIYFEWSGPSSQWIVVPWTLIATPGQAMAFAKRLEDRPSYRSSTSAGTSISGAIDFSLHLLTTIPVSAIRQVIDISGDGINDHGRPVTQARDEAVSRGVTINGLPIRLDRSEEALGVQSLEEHYRDCVIGGPGAFIVPVHDHHEMAGAIKTKITREIASIPPQPLIKIVQADDQWRCQWMTSRHNPSQ